MSTIEKKYIFLWGDRLYADQTLYREICPYCNIRCVVTKSYLTKEEDGIDREEAFSRCPLCGWSSNYAISDNLDFQADSIRAFDINSCEVPLTELGSYLKKNFADIYSLEPSKFEEIIADVFRYHSYRPVLTKASRDGGVDIFLVNEKTDNIESIVQCKRYAEHRKVGIATVQRLVGTAVEWDVEKAYLVTTSSFTAPAQKSARKVISKGRIELDLYEASDVMSLLQAYNTKLPLLSHLTDEIRAAIIKNNGGLPG